MFVLYSVTNNAVMCERRTELDMLLVLSASPLAFDSEQTTLFEYGDSKSKLTTMDPMELRFLESGGWKEQEPICGYGSEVSFLGHIAGILQKYGIDFAQEELYSLNDSLYWKVLRSNLINIDEVSKMSGIVRGYLYTLGERKQLPESLAGSGKLYWRGTIEQWIEERNQKK